MIFLQKMRNYVPSTTFLYLGLSSYFLFFLGVTTMPHVSEFRFQLRMLLYSENNLAFRVSRRSFESIRIFTESIPLRKPTKGAPNPCLYDERVIE